MTILETLNEIGRETGRKLINTAVSTAKNNKQMDNQIHISKVAAIHILATIAYNMEIQDGKNLTDVMNQIRHEIDDEIYRIKTSGMMMYRTAGRK